MKTLKEVCDIVDMPRQRIHDYERLGLIKPAGTTKSKHLLYDDEGINTLILIKIFKECGYKQKEIKEIFESDTDFFEEFGKLTCILEKNKWNDQHHKFS